MRSKLIVACLGLLALCGLSFAQKSAGADLGSNSGVLTWTSGSELGTNLPILRTSQVNRPGRCASGVITYCTSLPTPCPPTIDVRIPFVCQPIGAVGRCASGSGLVIRALIGPGTCQIIRATVAFWCFQRG